MKIKQIPEIPAGLEQQFQEVISGKMDISEFRTLLSEKTNNTEELKDLIKRVMQIRDEFALEESKKTDPQTYYFMVFIIIICSVVILINLFFSIESVNDDRLIFWLLNIISAIIITVAYYFTKAKYKTEDPKRKDLHFLKSNFKKRLEKNK